MTEAPFPAAHAAATPAGRALSALLRADAVVLLHNRVSMVLSIMLPLIILIATTLGKNPSRLGSATLVIGLALTLGIAISCLLGYSLALAHDREAGVLQRLRVTPVATWTIMSSRLAVQLAVNLLASVVVIIVGAAIHGLSLGVGQYLLALAVAILGAALFLAMGQALVALVRSAGAISAIGRALFIVLLLLGLVGGTGVLGDTVQAIANWSPVGALMTLFSTVLGQTGWSGPDTGALLACAGYIVVFCWIGIRWFRWEGR